MKRSLLSALLFLAACATPRAAVSPTPAAEPQAAATPSAEPERKPGSLALPFVENDYARALAEAKQRELPLFVDVWTQW